MMDDSLEIKKLKTAVVVLTSIIMVLTLLVFYYHHNMTRPQCYYG